MTALISFPQVLGHELVGDVVDAGPTARERVGERVVLDPWLACAARGVSPPCPACHRGEHSLCHSFDRGHLPAGIHVGNCSAVPGGFGELVPAHTSMAIRCPAELSDEDAVLADPFSVALHSVLLAPPPPGGTALVYGCGTLGLATCEVLRTLHPDVEVHAVARFPHQASLAEAHGARPLAHEPAAAVVDEVAARTGARLQRPWAGTPMLHPGGVDVVYDTVGSGATLEVGVRVLRARGALVLTGVDRPTRFEWTPWYFKELRLLGSNAFGVEEVAGVRRHAIEHYLDWARTGRVSLRDLLTHTFRLEDWRDAFAALAEQGASGVVKAAFDHR